MADQLAREINGRVCVSSAVMQDVFAISRATLGNWAKQGCPKERAGWWPLAEVIRWKYGGTGKTEQSGLSDEALKKKFDAEYKRLQAERLEFNNAIDRGDYVSREEIISTLATFFAELKRSFTAYTRVISQEVAPYVDQETARRISHNLDEKATEFLRRISTGVAYSGAPVKRKKIRNRKKA